MTRMPAGRPGGPRPGGAPSQGAPTASVDPVKLIKKYKFVLVGAFVFSVVFGVAAFFVLQRVMPQYKATVVFEATPAEIKTEQINVNSLDIDEINRFMRTQVMAMTSESVLWDVAGDGRLLTDAPEWAEGRLVKGTVDKRQVVEDLESSVSVSIIPETYYIRMSASAPKAGEAAALAKLVRESYMNSRTKQTRGEINNRRESLSRRIDSLENEIKDLSARRARIVRDEELDTIDAGRSEASEKIGGVNTQLLQVSQTIEAVEVSLERFETMLTSPTGIQYTDTQRAQAERDPEVGSLNQQITNLEAQRLAMRAEGILPGHRSYRQIEAQISAHKQKLADKREQKLREIFDAEVDGTRRTMAQLRAQESELLTEREALRVKLNELTGILTEVGDLETQIDRLLGQRADAGARLDQLESQADLDTVARMLVSQREVVPSVMSFPKVVVIVPLSVLLICGLTGSLIVAREMLDQRIKGASDVAMIPRTRVVGVVPIASEDPSSPERIELAFADQPRGVIAESYRQLRTGLVKSMARAGHKSLVVTSGLPGSGATSVVTNLAHACAATDQRVLIIDANFRRPAMHGVFALAEGPGLADVLAGEMTLAETAQNTTTTNIDLLTAGSRDRRVFERLGTEAMASVLTEAADGYDLILIDVAPCIVAGDAVAVANRADASLLVTRALREKRGMVARIKNELSDSRAEFMGVLVNAARSAAGGYMRKNIRTSHGYQQEQAAAAPVEPVESGA
ncbi:MAG: hypothetical protein DHS20C14_03130 [Phycisphaeraceae bacterium]|nr:MAG: hypothetical protein DHS20C14_03130 [Phycisphaeraceae bacterium]